MIMTQTAESVLPPTACLLLNVNTLCHSARNVSEVKKIPFLLSRLELRRYILQIKSRYQK